jgi:multidrug efflux pump subunit AcrB
MSAIVGFGKVDMAGGDRSPESHRGYVDLAFADYDKRKASSFLSMQWMEENLPKELPGWNVLVKKQEEGPPQGYPVSFEITGDDYAVLARFSDSIKARLAPIPDLTNINTDFDPIKPELAITVDRDLAKRLGVNLSEVALGVRGSIHGFEAGKFRMGEDEHDVMVRLDPETRENFSGLDQITIVHEGQRVPLSSVAQMEQRASLASIRHLDGLRTVQVWAQLKPGIKDESKPKTAALEAMEGLILPPGYSLQTGSSNREQEETQDFLGKAFLVAIALVVLTMVGQFNSVSQPLLVFVGILISLGGVFWGLLIMGPITGVNFSVIMSGIGIIALAGVVAKNGIVLIDFINHLRKQGMPLRQAVIEGGATRLRPVLLTAVTAMIGLAPMATGIGFDFLRFEVVLKSESSMWWAPMAWAIFWGLLFNTLLVLVVVPTFYLSWEGFKERRGWGKVNPSAELGETTPSHS